MIFIFNSQEYSFVGLVIGVLSNVYISFKVFCYYIFDRQRVDSFSGVYLNGGVDSVSGFCQDDFVISVLFESGGRVVFIFIGYGS